MQSKPAGEPYRIMLIEDSRTQAERLRGLFETEGWEVLHAGSAEAALNELCRTRPDVIVVDYYLPGMKGDEFCREIRINANTRGIPVLMLTVEGAYDAETRGLESGADDYLAKSVDSDILLLRVGALLRKSRGPAAIPARTETFLSRGRLLAIDDSPTYLHYLVQELATENYVVETASSGQEGLERIRNERFDCVLVDLEMPEPDGIEVCRCVAELRSSTNGSVAVIMLTAHEDKHSMTLALGVGADDFIGKWSDVAVLKARIRAVLRRKSFMEESRRILEEIKNKELEAVRARAEKEAAEVRATMAEKLARSNCELEEANRKLRAALEVTRAITLHAAEPLFMTDREGWVTFMNPAAEQMFGFGPEEMLGAVLHQRVGALGEPLETGRLVTGHEDVFRRKDGTPVDVSCSNAPIVEDGQVTGAVLVVHDISDRKRSEERLRQAQKLESIGLLAGGVAHDFNNILTSVIGTASLMAEELPPAQAEKVQLIIKGAEQAANLTRQLLAYAGKGRFIIADLEISAVVRDLAGLIRLSVPKSIEVEFNLPEGLPLVPADPGQMQQVVMNLVINAGEAIGTGENGRVSVASGVVELSQPLACAGGTELPSGCYAYLEVTDSGCGMDERTEARVFDPFFTTKFTGRGLGLAAVFGITRSQKGGITVKSAPGQGSTFRVLFPAARDEDGKPLVREARTTVLVVDDEAGVRNFLKAALEGNGYAVLAARDGMEGLSAWEANRDCIALVLLDLVMPVMAGRQLLVEMKNRQPGVKVLLTSGDNEEEANRLCAVYEDISFIQKPYSTKALVQKIRTIIESN